MIDVSAVIPARNEEGNIPSLMGEIAAALQGRYEFEIIVVDDGSSDDTFACISRTAKQLGCRAQAVRHDASYGQSTAVMTGVRAARGRLIATLDGDGQNDPADLPAMLEKAFSLQAPHFCIAGHRWQRKDTAWKRFQSRLANRVRDALLHDGVPDTGCGLKVLPRNTFLMLPWFDHGHRFMPALVRYIGGQIEVMPVRHRDRQQGKSNYTAWNRAWVGIVDLCGVLWLSRRIRRAQVVETVVSDEPATSKDAASEIGIGNS